MGFFQARNKKPNVVKNESGVALFIVLSSVAILGLLVTEYVYVGEVNKRIAYAGLEQTKAYYLAKSAFKLSLLRLKAYQIIKDFAKSNGMDAMVPQTQLEKVWSFPLMFPIPTDIPGLGPTQKASIDTFMKESALEGSFTALIEAESSKYNINSVLPGYAYAIPSPSPSPSPSPTATFNVDVARQSLQDYLAQLFFTRFRDDRDFADVYRDLKVEDLMDSILSWSDPTYETRRPRRDDLNPKRAPFYSLTELRFLPEVDDTVFELLSGALTSTVTPGIHLNSLRSETLSALVPQMTKEEVTEFFKFRDSTEKDNSFKKVDDFYNYLKEYVGAFRNNDGAVEELKKSLAQKNIQLLIEEKSFRVTITARVNGSTRVIQAGVQLVTGGPKAPTAISTTGTLPVGPDGKVIRGDPGLQITFMRIW